MATINDVRKALWHLYHDNQDWEGKSAEGACELIYPAYWDCDNEEAFCEPTGLMVYSYAFGPSRQHYFFYGRKEKHPNYYTWESPNFYQTAVDVIKGWGDNRNEIVAEDAGTS